MEQKMAQSRALREQTVFSLTNSTVPHAFNELMSAIAKMKVSHWKIHRLLDLAQFMHEMTNDIICSTIEVDEREAFNIDVTASLDTEEQQQILDKAIALDRCARDLAEKLEKKQ